MRIRYCILHSYTHEGHVCAWQSAIQLLISYKSVQPVPARVEEPVSHIGNLLVVVPRTIHPFPGCPKPVRESRLSKLAYCQCVFRRRRRTRQEGLALVFDFSSKIAARWPIYFDLQSLMVLQAT